MGVLTERLIEVTEGKVIEEQGGFRKGKGCMDQTFTIKKSNRGILRKR